MRRLALLGVVAAAGCGRIDFDVRGLLDSGQPADGDGAMTSTIRLVQKSTFGSIVGSSASVSMSLPQVAGDTIVVSVWSWAATSSSFPSNAVVDDRGNAYVEAIALATTSCNGGQGAVAIFEASNIVGSSLPLTITATPSGGPVPEIGMIAIEYSGLSPTGPLDRTSSIQTPGTASPFTFGSGTVLMTRNDAELLAAVGTECAGAPNDVAWTDLAGFTIEARENTTATLQGGLATDKIVMAAGTYQDSWTVMYTGTSPTPGIGAIATFR